MPPDHLRPAPIISEVNKYNWLLGHKIGAGMVAGTFSFDCANGQGEIVHITDGRFDISL
jgi:hypothetical protein